MLKNKELLDSLTKDLNAGVKRLMVKPELLNNLDQDSLALLEAAVDDYSPKSEIGKSSKAQVIKAIDSKVAELGGVKVDPSTVSLMEEKTSLLTIKVPQPGFNMCINTRTFVELTKNPKAKVDLFVDDGDEDFDYSRHTVVQKLFGREYIRPLISQRAEFFSWLKRRAVPSSMLAHENYLIPRQLLSSVLDKIEELESERNQLLDQFEGQYDDAKKDAKKNLGVHFDASRYPEFYEVREKFAMYFRVQDTKPSEALKEISVKAYEKEQQRASHFWDSTLSEIDQALTAGLVDLVTGFADSMGNDEDGKPKVFHATKVEKLKDFLSTFEARNLTDNSKLSALAAQARELLETVDPKVLRKDEDLRNKMAKAFTDIKDKASELVVTRVRKVRLDD